MMTPPVYQPRKFEKDAGEIRMVKDQVSDRGTRTLVFERRGATIEAQDFLDTLAPKDGRYIFCHAWVDVDGVGHLVMAWKVRQGEKQTIWAKP
jgi:hypothetical protein